MEQGGDANRSTGILHRETNYSRNYKVKWAKVCKMNDEMSRY